jgi:3-oxoacyl-[acyl-carrier-protein] synthase-1
MSAYPITVVSAGLSTSVGLSAAAACAAIRAAITNHTPTRFIDSDGDWIIGAQAPLSEAPRGLDRLVGLLSLAIDDCLSSPSGLDYSAIPLLLCVAEQERAGRLSDLDESIIRAVQMELSVTFHPTLSGLIAHGHVGALVALLRARTLLSRRQVKHVLIAAADSLLVGPTLAKFESSGRVLTKTNSNGFVPGEAGGAFLVGNFDGDGGDAVLVCEGMGFAKELNTIERDVPLRADGLVQAIESALHEASRQMHDLDFRITDNSGEQYYFKEASLALTRTLRQRRDQFDIWHPADCVGEVGAAIGPVAIAVALAACRKDYAVGRNILIHFGNDTGERAAAVFVCRNAS